MDKHTQAELVWGLFMICSLLGLGSIAKAWVTGEINRSATNSWKFRKMSREEDPAKFNLYLLAMLILNVFFFLAVVVWGVVVFR